jgi:hypothetical protein
MHDSSAGVMLTTAYFPPVEYFIMAVGSGRVLIEKHENYTKQSYRNRCNILSANGILPLVIPVKRYRGKKTVIKDVRPDNHYNWQKLHMISIRSAYRSAPFYEFYIDDIMPFFTTPYESLLYLNTAIFKKMLELLNISISREYTRSYSKYPHPGFIDGRETIHPKKINPLFAKKPGYPEYSQVFGDRWGYVPGLSILDLLFNTGPDARGFLKDAASEILT